MWSLFDAAAEGGLNYWDKEDNIKIALPLTSQQPSHAGQSDPKQAEFK